MKITLLILVLLLSTANFAKAQKTLQKEDVMKTMELANEYLMKKWPEPGQTVTTNRERPSNLWTRATYYEGLMALYSVNSKDKYYKYALDWAEAHQWKFRGREVHTPVIYSRDANVLCAAQTYIELYLIDPQPERIINARLCADSLIHSDKKDDWFWIDALQMAMPVFAKLGVIYKDDKYFDKMHQMYLAALFTCWRVGCMIRASNLV